MKGIYLVCIYLESVTYRYSLQIVDPAVLCLGLLPAGWQVAVDGVLVGHVVRASPAVQNGLSGEALLLRRLLLCLLLLLDGCGSRRPIASTTGTTPVHAARLLSLIAIYIATVVGRLLRRIGSVYTSDQTGGDFAQGRRTAVRPAVMDGEAIRAGGDPTQYGRSGTERRVGGIFPRV